jgi:hypothetical protein
MMNNVFLTYINCKICLNSNIFKFYYENFSVLRMVTRSVFRLIHYVVTPAIIMLQWGIKLVSHKEKSCRSLSNSKILVVI